MSSYLGVQDATYIVGRPFTDEDGEHQPGEEYSAEQAAKLHYLESFVSSGYLFRVWDKNSYDLLPPHVFNAVRTVQEAKDAIAGDQSDVGLGWEKPAPLKQSEKEAEVQAKIHENVLEHARQAHQQRGLTDSEKVVQAELEQKSEVETQDTDGTTDGRIRKATAKKTAAKKA